MSDVAIRVEHLSKKFYIGKNRGRYATLRETIKDAFLEPFRRMGKLLRGQPIAMDTNREFWALKDISFEVSRGEVIGLIGRNGAGKSTLLKILTRITDPTGGSATIHGRVGSLLEVGSGFHPELTGRENIYLNGAILGMRKTEIDAKFDEIVAFSEVEEFIDTPVKHYSSGMYMRLAFAVAAHLETEILLVDEVLAVGDMKFQRKCLNKMQDIGKHGRTVLFVSHNMPAVSNLCQRVILLDEGKIIQDGPSLQVVGRYLSEGFGGSAVREWPDPVKAPGNEGVRLRAVRVKLKDGQVANSVGIREPVSIEVEFDVLSPDKILLPSFGFWNEQGICAFISLDSDPEWRGKPRPSGHYVSSVTVPGNFLSPGTIYINVGISGLEPFHQFIHEQSVAAFQVVDNFGSNTSRGDYTGGLGGVVRPLLEWNTRFRPRKESD
jgi:lipopolysaccharide transport system ATP-binding protein